MEMIDLLKGPAAMITTIFIGYWMIRAVIWITQKPDE
jgi:hypothetical protein